MNFKTLRFKDNGDFVRAYFFEKYYFDIEKEKLSKISDYNFKDHEINFKDEKRAERKFRFLIDDGLKNLYDKDNKRKVVYVYQNSGIPLLGTYYFGIVDKGTGMIEIKPNTGCNINCIFCSVDEGLSGKKAVDYFVEKDYLVTEIKKILEYKKQKIEIYINPNGEPTLYPELIDLIKDVSKLEYVNGITLITNAQLIDKEFVDRLVEVGLKSLNISLCAIDSEIAKKLAGYGKYDVKHVMEIAKYASKKLKVIIAPVYVPGVNDDELPKLIEFANSIDSEILIQNFLFNPKGRNPVKTVSWDEFFEILNEYEGKSKYPLIKKGALIKSKEYPKPFKKGDIVKGEIVCEGRVSKEKIISAKGRAIVVPKCDSDIGKMINLKIRRTKNNIFYGEKIYKV